MQQPISNPASHRSQAGMTIVELGVATVLIVSIIALTHSSTMAVHSATRYSEKRLSQESSARNLLNTVRSELSESTLEKDPRTNLYRYYIEVNKWGKQALTFQKLTSATMVGGEIEPVWSTNITVTVNNKNQAVRIQDGRSRILGVNIKEMFFETTLSGKFKVTCKTERPDRRTGKTKEVHDYIYVKPTY